MKKLFALLFIVLSCSAFAQLEDVPVEHKVYDFFTRLNIQHIISGYSAFESPISRKDVAKFLKQAQDNSGKLDESDRKTLSDLEKEFEFDLYGTTDHQQSLLEGNRYNILAQDPKYIYYYVAPGTGNVWVNFYAQGDYLALKNKDYKNNSVLGIVGGEIRGTLYDKFGFYIHSTDGNAWGNRDVAMRMKNLRYNWNLQHTQDNSFFDETRGYCTAEFFGMQLKFGRDRELRGYGPNKLIMSDNAPEADFIALKFSIGALDYSTFHGKLVGPHSDSIDAVQGIITNVQEKYLVYHRLSFRVSKTTRFSAGEMVIYSDRGLDLSYLNPIAFYKTIEHSNQDRDNSLLFFDLSNTSIEGWRFYAEALIDDINAGKVGTGWYGNQMAYQFGITSFALYKVAPVDFNFDYIHVEPYVFTHRIQSNNYTNDGYAIGLDTDPNSAIIAGKVTYRPTSRLNCAFQYSYRIHGANPIDPVTGVVTKNVGGDINLGHRESDDINVHFMDGSREIYRKVALSAKYELFIGTFFAFTVSNQTNSLQNYGHKNEWFMDFGGWVRL